MNLSQKSNLSDSRVCCMDDQRIPLTDLLARLAYNAETRRYGQKDLEDRILKRCRLEKFYYSPWR